MREIRQHIKDVIEGLELNLYEHKKDEAHYRSGMRDYFNKYTVECEDFSYETMDNLVYESCSPILSIVVKNNHRDQSVNDDSVSLGRDIVCGISNPKFKNNNISEVRALSISVSEFESNPDYKQITINLDYRISIPLKG